MDRFSSGPAQRIVASLERVAASAYEEGFGHAAAAICALADVLAATQFETAVEHHFEEIKVVQQAFR
ncbi:MAG TPA: hypothetical protein VIL69_17305 [Roseomonas sp.]|jgi:hypothetical protein